MAIAEHTPPPEPRANPWLLGHTEAQARFVQEFTRGTPHHAYLLTGPKGIGKATLAYRFARYVLSEGALAASSAAVDTQTFSLFGDAPAAPPPAATATHDNPLEMDADTSLFRRIATGSHTDLLTISPAYDAKKQVEKTIISVEEARKVPEFLGLTAAEGLWRVVIVDAVDQLNDNAANALLKILEEPPARALLFLICHQPGGALATIRSRCRLLTLAPPSLASFSEILARLAPGIAPHSHAALYALSYGSPGLAMALAAQDGLRWYEEWLAALAPDARESARQKLAERAAASKSPQSWEAVTHGWRVAMQRLSVASPHASPISAQEDARLAAIRQGHTPLTLGRWLEDGARLLHATETFHLDKRETLRLLMTPSLLAHMAA